MYESKLPFKEKHFLLHVSFDSCKKHLENLYVKWKQDPGLLTKYNGILIAQKEAEVIKETPDIC